MCSLLTFAVLLSSGAAQMLVLLGLAAAVIIPNSDRWSKRFFITFFSVLVLYSFFSIADMLVTSSSSDMVSTLKVLYYFETLLALILFPMLTAYLLHCSGESLIHSGLFRAAVILSGICFIMMNFSPFTTWFYYFTPVNQYHRGPLYSMIIVLMDAIMILNLAGVIQRRNKLSKKCFYAFLIGIVPLTIALSIHLFISVFTFLAFGFSVCAFSMFVIILSDQIDQNIQQQREIAHQRARIMVLQMRPHFIHNTMTGIYYLCGKDPKKAQQVTLDFNTYLRKNFTAIASEAPVLFSEELEHARAYLAVEQAQYEDRLSVGFDTPHTAFRVPPLTLQPVVENAIKHGMDPDSEPLHISIRTRKTDSGSVIIVEDNGSGYDPEDDNEPHIALTNIRQRLEMMCGGKLEIKPRNGGGTMVKVVIPSEKRKRKSSLS